MYSIYGIHKSMTVLIMNYNVVKLSEAQTPEDYLLENGLDVLSADPVRELCLEAVQECDAVYSTVAGNGQRIYLLDRDGVAFHAYVLEA